ncbi:hypothetical protein HYV83_05490 [Candidatus Woesearchaeota archaeon]|nr:hypothetical protein [Candidatus Woesearchaeota archaeon]
MKITIDTKEDSPEEIRKLIKMLLALIGESSGYGEKSAPATGEGLFDMFGDPAASTSEQQQLGKGGSSGGMDINDFLDSPKEPSQQNSGSDDDDVKVVPY